MHVKNLLTVNAIYVGIIVLVTLFATSFYLEQNGIEVNDATLDLTRTIGAVGVGYLLSSWLMRNSGPSSARRAYLIGGGIGYLVVSLVFIFNYFRSDLGNTLTWVNIVIAVLLGIDFIFFGLKEPAGD